MKISALRTIGLSLFTSFAVFAAACGDFEPNTYDGAAVPAPINGADPVCNKSDASSGAECTQDCVTTCGFDAQGMKFCTCEGGRFSACPCFPPENYDGAETAPPCGTILNSDGEPLSPDGTIGHLNKLPCTEEFRQCVGSDLLVGTTTPKGCACLTSLDSGTLQWFCGSTNRWFRPE